MKKLIILIVICLIVSIPNWGVCQYWTYNINAEFGIKELENNWEPIDSHIEFGILLDFRQKEWPVNIAMDILHSIDDGIYINTKGKKINEKLSTLELDLGIRKIWAPKTVRPFIGGGIAFITGKYESSDESGGTDNYDDSALGVWFNGGLYWTIKKFNIGLDLRWSKANIKLSPQKIKRGAGGIHYGVILGYHY